jgi:hypothetical protein
MWRTYRMIRRHDPQIVMLRRERNHVEQGFCKVVSWGRTFRKLVSLFLDENMSRVEFIEFLLF